MTRLEGEGRIAAEACKQSATEIAHAPADFPFGDLIRDHLWLWRQIHWQVRRLLAYEGLSHQFFQWKTLLLTKYNTFVTAWDSVDAN